MNTRGDCAGQATKRAGSIRTVAVIGAGTMGAGIAGVFARSGYTVTLLDQDEARLEHGLRLLDRAQDALCAAGMLTRRDARTATGRVRPTTSLAAACKGVDLLIEAVSEDLALKRRLFRRFDSLCPKRALLATNTSGLSITRIAAGVTRPTRVAGLHFWNPPHVIPLVEITRGDRTSAATVRVLRDSCLRLGKRPIVIQHDIPGFVGNRIQFAVLREALHILNEGVASAEDIDTAVTAGPGLRWAFMGPLRTADLGGLDVFHAISSYLFAALASDRKPRGTLAGLLAKGRLGAKTGKGFYDYAGKRLGCEVAQRDRVLLRFLKVLRDERAGKDEAADD